MPTSRFSTTALRSAAPGLSRLAAALSGGGQGAYQQAFDNEQLNQSRIAQALSGIQRDEAAIGKYNADAAQQRAETALLERRPQQREELAALASGTTLPLVRAVMEASRSGQPATFEGVGPEPDGSALRHTVPAAEQSRISQALLRLAPVAMNAKDFGIDDWAKAQGAYREQDLGDDVLAGRRTAADVGRAQAAVAAKPLYNADASGSVLDLFAGGLDTSNPMAQATISLKGDQGKAQRANAAQSYAAAENSRASAEKTREEINRLGAGGGTGRLPLGYSWGPPDADGTPTMVPIKGGPADTSSKGAKLPAEVQRMNIALRSLDEGLNRYAELLDTFNPRKPSDQANTEKRAQIESLVADLRLQLKEAQALGALAGPDIEILDQALASPVSFRAALYGNTGLNTQLKEVRKALTRRKNALAAEYNRPELAQPGAPAPAAAAPAALPAGWSITPVPAGP